MKIALLIILLLALVIFSAARGHWTVNFWIKNVDLYVDGKKINNGNAWSMVTLSR
jgi:hypothetical protein